MFAVAAATGDGLPPPEAVQAAKSRGCNRALCRSGVGGTGASTTGQETLVDVNVDVVIEAVHTYSSC